MDQHWAFKLLIDSSHFHSMKGNCEQTTSFAIKLKWNAEDTIISTICTGSCLTFTHHLPLRMDTFVLYNVHMASHPHNTEHLPMWYETCGPQMVFKCNITEIVVKCVFTCCRQVSMYSSLPTMNHNDGRWVWWWWTS